MKKGKLFIYVFSLLLVSISVSAQTTPATLPKIGYTNVDFIIEKLPEAKVMANQLEVTRAQLEKAIDETMKEFQEKYEVYQKSGAQMTDVIRADKEKELQNLQTRVQEMRNNAQQSLQNKQEQLMSPLLTKVNNAIQEVGKENSYVYIFNLDGGAGTTPFILFAASEENNATSLILKKLGIDPDKADATNPQTRPATTPGNATPAANKPSSPTTAPATPKKK